MISIYLSSFCLLLIGLAESDPPSVDSRCGSYCLTVAIKALDAKISLETVEKKLGLPPRSGYSMNQLKKTAESFNYTTMVCMTTLENLKWRKDVFGEQFVCITLIRNDHYVILNEADDTTVYICDPPRLDKLDTNIFNRIWSGNVLLISNNSLKTEEEIVNRRNRWTLVRLIIFSIFFVVFVIIFGLIFRRILSKVNMTISVLISFMCFTHIGCEGGFSNRNPLTAKRNNNNFGGKLVIEPASHNLGSLLGGPGKTLRIDTRLTNRGRQPLRIYDILVSCDCTNATIPENDLQPGQSTILNTELKIGEVVGPRVTSISIRSSDETGMPKSINFEWISDNELKVNTKNLVFSNLPVGQAFNFDIPISSAYLTICKNCRFKIVGNTNLINSEWRMHPELILKDHTSKVLKEEPEKLGVIHSVLLPQTDDRHFETIIPLELICQEKVIAKLAIPIRWSFERDIAIAPTSISLGILKAGEIVRRDIFLKGSKNQSFNVMSISSSALNQIFDIELPNKSNSSAFISFSIRAPLKKGPWRELLTITTDLSKSKKIQVPISGIIED